MAITLTCADYIRIMPLATGAVPADFTLTLGVRGSWPDRAEALRRSTEDASVQGGESSMGIHLKRIDQGDRSSVALPIFVLRNFTGRDLYIRRGAALRSAAELNGKRIGMYSWNASGSIWYRHFLTWSGVDLDSIQWVIGNIDKPWGLQPDPALPPHVKAAPPGRSLAQMLIDGELDALYSPPTPKDYDPVKGPIVRLHPDSRAVERAYFAATGVFPPQHLVVLRRDAWEADKSLARRVTDAFIQCEEYFQAELRSFPYATPWTHADLEDSDAVLGPNPYAHGLDANRAVMEQFCDQAHRVGLTARRVAVDDYFREFLES